MEAIDEYVFPTRRYNATDAQGYPTIFDPGMSLRAYFAGQALEGLLAMDTDCTYTMASGKPCDSLGEVQTRIAEIAVGYADALIAELAAGGTK